MVGFFGNGVAAISVEMIEIVGGYHVFKEVLLCPSGEEPADLCGTKVFARCDDVGMTAILTLYDDFAHAHTAFGFAPVTPFGALTAP